jgi:membrane protein implicated in regulation of membrane protease activity
VAGWLILSGVLLAAEILTTQLVLASFSVGALAAGLTAAFTESIYVQCGVLIVVSSLTLLLIRPKMLERLYGDEHTTGIDKLIGQEGVVLEEVSAKAGTIRLNGEIWTARTVDGLHASGETVICTAVDGAIAIVQGK